MMTTAFQFLLFLSLSSLLLSASIPDYIRRGHFEGRSGNVVLSLRDSSPSLLLMEQSHHHFEGEIEDINVANLISHVFQSPPPSNEASPLTIDRSSFPVLSLFNAPSANLFITIEDIDRTTLAKYSSLSLIQNRKQIDIIPTFQSRDSLSSLETIISGCPPSTHGVVGRSWLGTSGTESYAFKDRGTGSHADSIFDVLAMTSPRSLVFSMSSDFQMAAAIGVRPESRNTLPNILSYYWNSKHQNFDILPRRSDLSIQSSRADVLHSFQNGMYEYDSGVEMSFDSKNMQLFVSIQSSNIKSVPFDLNSEQDFRIFVELFFVEKALQALREEPLSVYVNDDIPDSYAFAFAGIRSIRDKYGVDSTQFAAALHLLDNSIAGLTAAISRMYSSRITSEIVCLKVPQNVPILSDFLLQQLDEIVPSVVGDLVNYLPDIYLGNELSVADYKNAVAQMNSLLQHYDLTAHWFGRQDLHAQDNYLSGKRAEKHHAGPATVVTNPEFGMYYPEERFVDTYARWSIRSWFGFPKKDEDVTYTLEQINIFHITLWTGIALIFIGCGGCCTMCALNPEKNNELLYRQTALGRETDTIPGGEYDFKPM